MRKKPAPGRSWFIERRSTNVRVLPATVQAPAMPMMSLVAARIQAIVRQQVTQTLWPAKVPILHTVRARRTAIPCRVSGRIRLIVHQPLTQTPKPVAAPIQAIARARVMLTLSPVKALARPTVHQRVTQTLWRASAVTNAPAIERSCWPTLALLNFPTQMSPKLAQR